MNKKKILSSLLTVAFFVAIIAVGFSWNNLNEAKGAPTGVPENSYKVIGWAWSDNIGWIKFNPSYGGVFYNNETGEFSGYAWSNNIGWIKFDGLSSAPGEGNLEGTGAKTVRYLKDGNISGSTISDWARACAGTTSGDCSNMASRIDGWDGWIKMSGEVIPAPGSYNVTIDSLNETETNKRDFHGYAWGSDVVGWISFNCMEGGPNGSNICPGNNVAKQADYRAQIDFGPSSSGGSSSSVPNIDQKMTFNSCSVTPVSPFVDENVTFKVFVENGKGPFTYIWSGADYNSLNNKKTNDRVYSSSKTFSTGGKKEVKITIKDKGNANYTIGPFDCSVSISPIGPSSSSKPKVQIIEI